MKGLGFDVERLPFSIRVLLENAMRHSGRVPGAAEAVVSLAGWGGKTGGELPFMPFRVLLQDYTGVPLIVDLAAMRDAARAAGIDPRKVNSKVPVDLVIDHSIQVDAWSSMDAFQLNLSREYERNSERYALLKWAQGAFDRLRVFPPGKGICHQFNLEYLTKVVATAGDGLDVTVFPDTLVGTDSHTTMVNGLGVLGWGVGGIEAEAVMLGEPYHMPVPRVLGVKLTGALREGVTPTDLVLTVTEKLRQKSLVGMFVEYFGEGYHSLTVPDRATLGNMSPEYGATAGFSPVDENTLAYLTGTGRDPAHVEMVRRYAQRFGFYSGSDQPRYSEVIEIDMDSVEASIAGPRNPEERRSLASVPSFARRLLSEHRAASPAPGSEGLSAGNQVLVGRRGGRDGLADGSVVIAAITSCTNTSNPTVMVGAGLLAKRAVELGISPKPWVKRSMAPGSTVVTDYLENSGLLQYLDRLGFNVVGYGCTTCIGNSGPLSPEVESAIKSENLYPVAVLSGNRNFDGRIHPLVRGAFLMSPVLVVAYALAGRIDFDFGSTPLGEDPAGKPVYLKDMWPTMEDVGREVRRSLAPSLYTKRYAHAMEGDARWEKLSSYKDDVFRWDPRSVYIRQPPWFSPDQVAPATADIKSARALALFGDKVTTDHISPAGTIPVDSPAGIYLTGQGVKMIDFSSYGGRRGNHEVMVRGGFANPKLRNAMVVDGPGGWATHHPSGEAGPIFDVAMRYAASGTPLIVLAGRQYGTGSSRDWAAKAPKLLGVKAVIAQSFERIHRSNLVAMGVLPLQFEEGQSWEGLGITGDETFDVSGLQSMTAPRQAVTVTATKEGQAKAFHALCRIDNDVELQYARTGGILPFVFDRLRSRPHA
jgi:aconitate hydratase A / 2-methylisocitrate dehydratase